MGAAQWSRVVNTTTKNYLRKVELNTLRQRKLLAVLQKKGRITYNVSGRSLDWKVEYKKAQMTGFAGGDTQEFARKDRWKSANLEWRGYNINDSMDKDEFLANRSTQAIVKVFGEMGQRLSKDMTDSFGSEFYINGNLPQNAKRMHGIESFMAATANAGNGAATPTGSYAGLQCAPGYYGGTWSKVGGSSNWPNGYGDVQYDFFSPIVVDYGDTLFPANPAGPDGTAATGGNTWLNNAVEAISFAIIKSRKSPSESGQLDMLFVDDEMYRQYLSRQRTKERIDIDNSNVGLKALGFTDTIRQDGVDITMEYGLPVATGYGFNCDEIEVCSRQAQLFVPEGPDYDLSSKSWRMSVDFYGNIKWNPKFQIKLAQITAITS